MFTKPANVKLLICRKYKWRLGNGGGHLATWEYYARKKRKDTIHQKQFEEQQCLTLEHEAKHRHMAVYNYKNRREMGGVAQGEEKVKASGLTSKTPINKNEPTL